MPHQPLVDPLCFDRLFLATAQEVNYHAGGIGMQANGNGLWVAVRRRLSADLPRRRRAGNNSGEFLRTRGRGIV